MLRKAAPRKPSTSTTPNSTFPAVGSSSRSIDRPIVVFPHPDSPTTPSVSPRAILNETSFTARISAAFFRESPRCEEKLLLRCETSSNGASLFMLFTDALQRAPPAVRVDFDVDPARPQGGNATHDFRQPRRAEDAPSRIVPRHMRIDRETDNHPARR